MFRKRLIRRRSARSGITLLEIAVTVAILTVSVAMYAQTITAASRLDPVANETMLAAEGARLALERMRAAEFDQVFALYNADPTDDPLGPGTAPGGTFTIDGLLPATSGAVVGRIEFPVVDGLLRETSVDAELVMPRDINLDGLVDGESRADDYAILPARIVVEWASKTGKHGRRSLVTYAMFSPL